jgi:hypothetical protein
MENVGCACPYCDHCRRHGLVRGGLCGGHGSAGRVPGAAATGSAHRVGLAEDRRGVQPRLRHRRLRTCLHAWDARSQAIITRAGYIKRHKDCPGGSQALSQTESVSPGGPHGAWLVHEIGGQQLTDYWFYVHWRWVFDLVLSNPDAVKLYRMSPQQYVAALGCNR